MTPPSNPDFEPLVDTPYVAKLLRMHEKTVQMWARDGKLPAVRMGRRWQFRVSELDAWYRRQIAREKPAESADALVQKTNKLVEP